MKATFPVTPISRLQQRPTELLQLISDGPVILAQRSTGVAVVTTMADWDRMAQRMARLERAALAAERLADVKAGNFVTGEQLDAEFAAMGIG